VAVATVLGIEGGRCFDCIDKDIKPTVWLCHLEGQEGREDEVEDVGI